MILPNGDSVPLISNKERVHFRRADLERGDHEEIYNWSKLWPNFRPQELACKCCGGLTIHFNTMHKLQYLRSSLWKRPIQLTSAYRCPRHNRNVGGAAESYHLDGRAFDIRFPKEQRDPVVASLIFWATTAGFKGFGLYPSFIHIDTGYHRTWDQQTSRLDGRDDVTEVP